jgi:hypothetical protein
MSNDELAMGRAAAIVAVHCLNAAIIVASPRVSAKLDPTSLRAPRSGGSPPASRRRISMQT